MRFPRRRSAAFRQPFSLRRWPSKVEVQPRLEALEDRALPTFFVNVLNNNDSGPDSLRQAIIDINNQTDNAVIRFNISGPNKTIQVLTPLDSLTVPTVVDGRTQPGWAPGGAPVVELDGSMVSFGDGLVLAGGNSAVYALAVNAFPGNGIDLTTFGNDIVQNCYIGTTRDGTATKPNNLNGIDIEFGSDNDLIGGTGLRADRNVISGNITTGIFVNGANNTLIEGNYIGTDFTGTIALGNGLGVDIGGSNSIIGGTANDLTNFTANLISGNTGDGLDISFFANNNQVLGNYIGLDVSGTLAVPNQGDGIKLSAGANNNVIGGTLVSGITNLDRNYIAGNARNGVEVNGSDGNLIEGNWIGLLVDVSGTLALANAFDGVFLSNATNTVVGGTIDAARNLISGNGTILSHDGVEIVGGNDNMVEGNYIGTDPTGTRAVPNVGHGVALSGGANNNLIGGTMVNGGVNVSRNLISGNMLSGVYISDSSTNHNLVEGNYIGTDVTGTLALGNGVNGVTIFDEAHDNTIGGTFLNPTKTVNLSANLISGNTVFGVQIDHESGASNNIVEGNFIGTDTTGKLAVPNQYGVGISGGAQNNVIGGTFVEQGFHSSRNIISGNTKYGVGLFDRFTSNNIVEDNYIGTDVTGTAAVPNFDGVAIYSAASNNFIGQTTTEIAGTMTIHHFNSNRIGGNINAGVHLYDNGTAANVVQNNYIGVYLDAQNHTQILPNGEGVDFSGGAGGTDFGATPNVIGTLTYNLDPTQIVPSPNFISGNLSWGVGLHDSNTSYNVVQGNYIGTDIGGTQALTNSSQQIGVAIYGAASNNLIGGTALSGDFVPVNLSRNLISGNLGDGVFVEGTLFGPTTVGNLIEGNFIGLDKTGFAPLGNGGNGIDIYYRALNTQIGGTILNGTASANISGNYIAANALEGISISGMDPAGSTGTTILANYIGVDITGTAPLTNGLNGIHVQGNSNGTTIGDGIALDGNTIWYNGANYGSTGGDAVLIDTAINNSIRGNSIYQHDPNLGIDLINGANGVFSDGALLPTVLGASLDSASSPSTITVDYTWTDPNWVMMPVFMDFYITDVCNGSGYGEGKYYLGSVYDTTDANGTSSTANMGQSLVFNIDPAWMVDISMGATWYVTATATENDPVNGLNNTSQFSACFTVTASGPTSGGLGLGAGQSGQPVNPVQPVNGQPIQVVSLPGLTLQAADLAPALVPPADPSAMGTGARDHRGRDWLFAHYAKHAEQGLLGGSGLLESALTGTL